MLLDLDFDVGVTDLAQIAVAPETYFRIQQFLFTEARLLDERRYAPWQACWTDDGMYWMPRTYQQASPYDHVSLIWEDRMLRAVRIRRLTHARNWSQQPPTHSARVVGGVEVEGIDGAGNWVVHSAFQMSEWRKGLPRQLAGRYTHKLVADGATWKIRMKRVDLINCDAVHDLYEGFI